jgi:hypothetical protein
MRGHEEKDKETADLCFRFVRRIYSPRTQTNHVSPEGDGQLKRDGGRATTVE